jgi:hypothetical protein
MKIQLEQKRPNSPNQLGCFTCRQNFTAPNIRALLCNDAGLIQGDICDRCLKLSPKAIQRRIIARSVSLQLQADRDEDQALPLRRQAFDLLLLSQENLTLPNFYTWLRKRWEILSQETQALEAARFGLNKSGSDRKRARLRIPFENKASQS